MSHNSVVYAAFRRFLQISEISNYRKTVPKSFFRVILQTISDNLEYASEFIKQFDIGRMLFRVTQTPAACPLSVVHYFYSTRIVDPFESRHFISFPLNRYSSNFDNTRAVGCIMVSHM